MTIALKTLRTGADLVAAGLGAQGSAETFEAIGARYAIAITPAMAALIDRDDPADPIARQFLPALAELGSHASELADPIGDAAHSPVPGIVHRYPDRALLKLLHLCPVYCRFCFRREMVGPGAAATLEASAVDAALAYIAEHPAIWEVILTGGDPMALSPRRLNEVMVRLAAIGHVKIIRLHSRVPAVDPGRVTDAMVAALRVPGAATYVALHANHARELTPEARVACARLIDAGIPMLGQTVLLKGVNDNVATLAALMRAFVETRIKPYYLHHPDLAPGTAHFRVGIAEGQALVRALQGSVSGLCQPTYVLDIPGGHGKAPIGPSYLVPDGGSEFSVRDFNGAEHLYPPV